MPELSITLMIGLEIAAAALFLLGLVLLHARSLSKTAAALERKVVELRQRLKGMRLDLKAARAETGKAKQGAPDYAEFIDTQINATRNHHLSLNAERDIVLDMAAGTPLERRAVSLRHAFLIAEKEAWLACEGAPEAGAEIDWNVLAGKLGQIIQFYEQSVPAEEDALPVADALDLGGDTVSATGSEIASLQEIVDNQKRHIENLERFKKLFFDADEKWLRASREAEQYRQELLEQSHKFSAGGEFNALLEKYSRVYSDFGATLAAEKTPRATQVIDINADQPSVGRMVIANQEELQRLRNMAVDQHKMILHLRQELEGAQSAEEKDRVIGELHKQLERHERFLKESDICTKQLEAELDRAFEDNHALKQKVLEMKQAAEPMADPSVEQMANIIEDFTRQSSEMLNAIEMLEAECGQLREQLAATADSTSSGATAKAEELKQQLASTQQELLNLQTQHIELEERYLELKAASL